MAGFRALITQSPYYLLSNTIIAIIGFISFPVWTRVLSREEYGIFNIIVATIFFLSAISKFGLQHSVVRFYSDVKQEKTGHGISHLYSTLILSGSIFGLVISLVLVIGSFLIPQDFLSDNILGLLRLSLILVFVGSLKHIIMNFYRAEQKAKVYSFLAILGRIGRFSFSLIFVLIFMWGLYGLFLGRIVFEATVLLILILIVVSQRKLVLEDFSLNLLSRSIKYGFPLIGFELTNYFLALGDRYVIQYFLKAEAVGIYSAGYNLSQHISDFFSSPLRLAVIPIYLSMWNRYGNTKTRDFLEKLMNYYLMIGIPLIFGLYCLRGEIITLLASEKYIQSKDIIAFVFPAMIVYNAYFIYGAGLYIQKKTLFLLYSSALTCILNLALNIILVPRLGIMGSAVATLISYMSLALLIAIKSYSSLRITVNLNKVFFYFALSLCMSLIIISISGASLEATIFKIATGALFYLATLAFFDQEIKSLIVSSFKRQWLVIKRKTCSGGKE